MLLVFLYLLGHCHVVWWCNRAVLLGDGLCLHDRSDSAWFGDGVRLYDESDHVWVRTLDHVIDFVLRYRHEKFKYP